MPPKSSGGMVVSNYIVEHKTVKTEWSSANHESVNGIRFALPMKESETYTVRVRAVNRLGLSEPSNVITIKLTGKWSFAAVEVLKTKIHSKIDISYLKINLFTKELGHRRLVFYLI